MARMTKLQRRLINEIGDISAEVGLNYQAILEGFEGTELTEALRYARRQLIVAAIVTEYTLLDELLGSIISRYFFGGQAIQSTLENEAVPALQLLHLGETLPTPEAGAGQGHFVRYQRRSLSTSER